MTNVSSAIVAHVGNNRVRVTDLYLMNSNHHVVQFSACMVVALEDKDTNKCMIYAKSANQEWQHIGLGFWKESWQYPAKYIDPSRLNIKIWKFYKRQISSHPCDITWLS